MSLNLKNWRIKAKENCVNEKQQQKLDEQKEKWKSQNNSTKYEHHGNVTDNNFSIFFVYVCVPITLLPSYRQLQVNNAKEISSRAIHRNNIKHQKIYNRLTNGDESIAILSDDG